jgi:exonuclease SbcC
MIPETLRLNGFAGIRAGLGRDELALDFAQLAGDAQLVALSGPNGAGKTTVMDNLQPYRLLPSRASSLSPAGFSFYEHLVLPQSVKELVWRHQGARYRSTLVFRMNGRRKTEAYLHVEENAQWRPMKLADGTVSDGRVETYDACVEALLGNPETFFTSVFAAQNRRPLSSYTAGEIKELMVEFLGLARIRQTGEKASAVARLLRTTLDERRRALGGFGDADQRIAALEHALARSTQELNRITQCKAAARAEVERAHATVVQLGAERDANRAVEEHRAAVNTRLADAREALAKALSTLAHDREREQARVAQLAAELREAGELAERRRTALAARRKEANAVLARKGAIAAAIEQAKSMGEAEERLRAALEAAQAKHQAREEQSRALAVLRTEAEGRRRQAGDAALRAAGLRQRFGLTDAVPCRGTELQPRCQLLADARDARVMLPSADAEVTKIAAILEVVGAEIERLEVAIGALGDTARGLRASQGKLQAMTEERRRVEALAALAASVQQAEQRLAEYAAADEEINLSLKTATERFARESEQAAANIAAIDRRSREQADAGQASIRLIETEIAALPPAFDAKRMATAEAGLQAARLQLQAEESACVAANKKEAALQVELGDLRTRASAVAKTRSEVSRIEGELGWWNLLAKALGNDGVIALCVDDAGPELARLTNELLLACYGPRFTVSIRTQVETVKRELREGFDVVVFDAETGQAKSVAVMSGGERIWINEALTRAIALYLARSSGRRYETLFCDEADGALDSERKRMFMQMKREVLRLGGYTREFFVSQTPELTQMADVVIDLAALARTGTAMPHPGTTAQDLRSEPTPA